MPYFNLMVLGHQNGDVAIKEYRLNNSWPGRSTLPHNYEAIHLPYFSNSKECVNAECRAFIIYTGATEVP